MPIRITDEGRAAWKALAAEHGVSVTTLIETLGLCLGELDHPPPIVREAIARARKLDADRRFR